MAGRKRTARQQAFEFRTHGGKRTGAGQKPAPGREGMLPHGRRPPHDAKLPVHVTMRAVTRCPSLRAQTVYRRIRGCLVRATRRRARVIHFSVQSNHIHFILEADDANDLARAVQGLASGIARSVNRASGRKGQLWRERYHRHELATPREVRNAYVYVIQNVKKHGSTSRDLDPCSSAAWFTGWDARASELLERVQRAPPVAEIMRRKRFPVRSARTWLMTTGWKRARGGLIRTHEVPA